MFISKYKIGEEIFYRIRESQTVKSGNVSFGEPTAGPVKLTESLTQAIDRLGRALHEEATAAAEKKKPQKKEEVVEAKKRMAFSVIHNFLTAEEEVVVTKKETPAEWEAAAKKLSEFYNDEMGWDSGEEHGEQTWNHWSGAKEELEKSMKRRLTRLELTIFSLSLFYGPTPVFGKTPGEEAMKVLWPHGNNTGASQDPVDVVKKLKKEKLIG